MEKLEKVFTKLDESGEGLITEAHLNQMLPGISLEEMATKFLIVLQVSFTWTSLIVSLCSDAMP